MPGCWKEASFDRLRTEGAFLVSAIRKDGRTRKLEITSLAGQPCIVRSGFEGEFFCTLPSSRVKHIDDQTVSLDLKKGETAVLYSEQEDLHLKIEPCDIPEFDTNYWGNK